MTKISVEQELNKARSHEKKGETIQAKNIYERILEVYPKNLRVQKMLAGLNKTKQTFSTQPPKEIIEGLINLIKQNKFSLLVDQSKSVVKKYKEAFIVWELMGVGNKLLGNFDEAIKNFKKAIELNPNYENAYYNLGVLLDDYNKPKEAVEAYTKCISLNPKNADAFNNMGNSLRSEGKFDESINMLKKALLIQPDNSIFYNNMGNVYRDLGKIDKAIETYNKALLLKTNYAEAHYNLSFSYNLKGDLENGLKLYEWRLKKDKFPTRFPRENLIWNGEKSIFGKKFFVYEEQGLGDTIQFSRYLLLLKEKGAEVTFRVKKKMHALLKTLDKDIILVDSDPDQNNIDFETPLMSLPFLLKTNLNTIPSKNSYLFADHKRVKLWSESLIKDTFKVGICWQGSKAKIDFGRSFPLTLFKDISKLPNIELISLHKGEGENQIKDINFELTTSGDDFDAGENAFEDTAAIMMNCDLIITSDTATAHLAGALGCPTWVALKKVPDWRWMLEQNQSPWYPSIKLYRQKELGDWDYVFEIIKRDLESLIIQEKRIK